MVHVILQQKQLEKRKLAFINGRMTTHYPHKVKLFPKPILNIKGYINNKGIKLI